MLNEKKSLSDYIKNLTLMDLAMGEMIHQLEGVVVDDKDEER